MDYSQEPFIRKIGVAPPRIREILVVGSIGIGNLLLFSGALAAIRKTYVNARITVVVLKKSFAMLYENDPNVDRVIVLDVDRTKTLPEKIRFIRTLRKTRYHICITTFPANRLEYNVLAFLSGARWRIAHRYRSKRINTLSFLQNFRVPVDTSLHDFEQNLQLLRPLEINGNIIRKEMYLSLGPEEESGPFLRRHELEGKLLIGMHPGSSIDRGMIMKRWPIKHFSALCDWLSEQYGARVLLFGGPEEMPLREEVIKYSKSTPLNVSGLSFPATAALIRRCSLFITNDSGLMHVAVAAGTRTAALFGPTDPGRTAPYGDGHEVIRLGLKCSPCWSVHNLGVGNVNCIHPENVCMTQMTVEYVKMAVKSLLESVKQNG